MEQDASLQPKCFLNLVQPTLILSFAPSPQFFAHAPTAPIALEEWRNKRWMENYCPCCHLTWKKASYQIDAREDYVWKETRLAIWKQMAELLIHLQLQGESISVCGGFFCAPQEFGRKIAQDGHGAEWRELQRFGSSCVQTVCFALFLLSEGMICRCFRIEMCRGR